MLAMGLLALLATLTLAHGGEAQRPAVPPGLGDAQLVGQRLIAGFAGEQPPADLRRRIAAGRLAGVVLFADNFDSRSEAEGLIRELQSIPRPRGLRKPLLVM